MYKIQSSFSEAERNLDSFLAELSFGQLRLKLLITSKYTQLIYATNYYTKI